MLRLLYFDLIYWQSGALVLPSEHFTKYDIQYLSCKAVFSLLWWSQCNNTSEKQVEYFWNTTVNNTCNFKLQANDTMSFQNS